MRCFVMDFEGKNAWAIARVKREHAERTDSLISIGLVLGRHVSQEELREWVTAGYAKATDYAKANAGGRW